VRNRVERLRRQLADERGGQVVLLSHCLLNVNTRYLGGARHSAGCPDVVEDYLAKGIGIHQLPCPEREAWGGVLKRRMLLAYGATGPVRAPVTRLLLGPFLSYTRIVYARLARRLARDVRDYQRSSTRIVGVVGVAGSPSCGVVTTLDLAGSLDALNRCPLAQLDRRTLVEDVVAANVHPGEGVFISALHRQFAKAGLDMSFEEHSAP
jgi:predicted secreted protein